MIFLLVWPCDVLNWSWGDVTDHIFVTEPNILCCCRLNLSWSVFCWGLCALQRCRRLTRSLCPVPGWCWFVPWSRWQLTTAAHSSTSGTWAVSSRRRWLSENAPPSAASWACASECGWTGSVASPADSHDRDMALGCIELIPVAWWNRNECCLQPIWCYPIVLRVLQLCGFLRQRCSTYHPFVELPWTIADDPLMQAWLQW